MPHHVQLATLVDTDWQPCGGSCAWHVSTQAQFCVARLTSFGAGGAVDAAITPASSSLPTAYQTPAGAFPALGPTSDCALGEGAQEDLRVRACIPEAALLLTCDAPSWAWVPAASCSTLCGGGTRDWRLVCQDRFGTWLRAKRCQGDKPLKPSAVVCNTAPCGRVAWVPGPWSECDAFGWRRRELACAEFAAGAASRAVNARVCAQLEAPATEAQCTAGISAESFECQQQACYRGNCTDDGSACACEQGWHGAHCDFKQGCSGIIAADGGCCAGLRSASGNCCAAGQELDRYSECCAPSELDACRVCRGSSTAVDLAGSCGTGRLDAGGLRCDGVLDGAQLQAPALCVQCLLQRACLTCTLEPPCSLPC